jgi:hypothetical protein
VITIITGKASMTSYKRLEVFRIYIVVLSVMKPNFMFSADELENSLRQQTLNMHKNP